MHRRLVRSIANNPVTTAGAVSGLISAVMVLLVAFHVGLTADQQSAILAVVSAGLVLIPIVGATVAKSKVGSPSTVKALKAASRRSPESVVAGKRLGRHVHHDPRSRNYPAPLATTLVSVTHPTVGLPLDQGDVGSCTANALCGALNTGPNHAGTTYTEKDAQALYHEETVEEGSPWPPNDPGGSGVAVCKAAEKLTLGVTSYTHTFNLTDALAALVLRPVIIGINWYTSFDTPDSTGLVAIGSGATVRGGHEVLVFQLDVQRKLVGCMNSWGTGFGVGGVFYMSWDTLGQLLDEQGDVTVPITTPVPAPTPVPTPPEGSLTVVLTDPAVIAHVQRNAPSGGQSGYVDHALAVKWKVS